MFCKETKHTAKSSALVAAIKQDLSAEEASMMLKKKKIFYMEKDTI